MSKPEYILRQEGAIKRPEFCNCDDGYWMRNLIDPGCHYHGAYAEELRTLITELCDALERRGRFLSSCIGDSTLIQRAREATR